MAATIPFFMLFLYAAFFGLSAVIIIYLIYKRIKNKGKEDFEQRDN